MTPRQIVLARDIAQKYGLQTTDIMEEAVKLSEGDMTGAGGMTIDRALAFLTWAYAQPQQGETENE